MGRYRGRLDIIADVLKVVGRSAKKTQIMYQANLSYKVLQRYLKDVTAASLVSFEPEERCYVLTPKGYEYLEAYRRYCKINKSAEECLNDVCSKKKNLEELCANEQANSNVIV